MGDDAGGWLGLGGIADLSEAVSRSISAENPTGGKGSGARATTGTGVAAARDLGAGWKISPSTAFWYGQQTAYDRPPPPDLDTLDPS